MKTTFYLSLIILLSACGSREDLVAVDYVNLKLCEGRWYEIASLSDHSEPTLECVFSNYQLSEKGALEMVSYGHPVGNPSELKKETQLAKPESEWQMAKLDVQSFWPFSKPYYIMSIDDDYQFLLMGSPNREKMQILSRQPSIPNAIFAELLIKAQDSGFDLNKVSRIEQRCALEEAHLN